MSDSRISVFVSSPSDLDRERALVKDIVERLGQEYLPYFQLKPVLWEEEALTAAQSFQAGLVRPSQCEIVLVMLWTRLGTPLADQPYGGMTGTEWEFVDAVESSARGGGPEVLVYKKTAPRLVDVTDAVATREAVEDRRRLEAFFSTHFYNADGSFRRAFRQFDSDRALRDLVEGQLRKLLNRRIGAERGNLGLAAEWRASPFRAETPFEPTDAPVFVGREAETRELVSRLDALKGPGRGLVLISGASGVGKSSLIRAGLVPRLQRPFQFPGVAACRWCLIACPSGGPHPSEGEGSAGGDPEAPEGGLVATLAEALVDPGLLGVALGELGLDAGRLARLLAAVPEVAADQVRAALERTDTPRGNGRDEGRRQLAVIVDPMDGLLSDGAHTRPEVQSFADALAALAARDGIWVVAALRSDRLRQLPRLPALAGQIDDLSWIRLDHPPPARIRQVIEIPARVAGIEYEEGESPGGHGLVEALESEAAGLAYWPALLERALSELYERSRELARAPADGDPQDGAGATATAGGRRLALADYRAMGGIGGAVLTRAERLWSELDPGARAALPRLCRALVALEGASGARPTPRAGDLRTLSRDPDCARLVEALTRERLAVTEGMADPAALKPCPETEERLGAALARLLRETRDEWRARFFHRRSGGTPLVERRETRGRAGVPEAEGDRAERAARAPPGDEPGEHPWRSEADGIPGLGAGTAELESFRPVATFTHPDLIGRWPPVRDWLRNPANRRDLELRFRIARQASLWKRTDCNREYLLGELGYAAVRGFALSHPDELEPQEREFLDRSLGNLRQQRQRNRIARLAGLSLAVLLAVASGAALWAWNASREATLNLHRSMLNEADLEIARGNTPEAVRLALDAGISLPQAASDTLSRAFTVNRLIAMAQGDGATPSQPVSPAFADDGQRLATLTAAGAVRLWRLERDRFVTDGLLAEPGLPIHAVRFAGSGQESAILGIGTRGVWRLPAAPQVPPDWSCPGSPGAPLALGPAGRLLAIAHPTEGEGFGACVVDLARPGAPLWDLPLHRRDIRDLRFSQDGALLVTASRDGTALVLETATGRTRTTLPPEGPLRRPINSAAFDAEGKRIVLACADERVRVYDLQGQLLATLGDSERDGRSVRVHASAVRDAVFSADGRWVIAGDDEGQVVRWGLADGKAEILGQHALTVERVRVTAEPDPQEREPLVLSTSIDKSARLWGLQTGKALAVLSHRAPVTEAHFSSDGRRVLSYSEQDGSARLWSVQPVSGLSHRLPHQEHVWNLDMARPAPTLDSDPGAVLIATASFDGVVRVWRYDAAAPSGTPVEIWRLVGHGGRVRRVSFSPSARLLASAAYDATVRVWDMATGGTCVLEPAAAGGASGVPTEVYRALFSPDEGWLLSASNDRARPVRLWDPRACAELPLPPALEQGTARVQALALAALDGGAVLAATGDESGTLRVARRGRDGAWTRLCSLALASDAIEDLAFAPDGRSLAAASEDGRAYLLEPGGESCGAPRARDSAESPLYSVAFAPDGGVLVTAARNGRAQVWDREGRRLADLVGHRDRIYRASFSPDGRWILTASRDGALRLWERPSGVPPEAGEIPVQHSYLLLAADLGGAAFARFSPDGKSVAAAYWQNAAVLWRLWSDDGASPPDLARTWGEERARLALIREAVRFRRDNRLDAWVQGDPDE